MKIIWKPISLNIQDENILNCPKCNNILIKEIIKENIIEECNFCWYKKHFLNTHKNWNQSFTCKCDCEYEECMNILCVNCENNTEQLHDEENKNIENNVNDINDANIENDVNIENNENDANDVNDVNDVNNEMYEFETRNSDSYDIYINNMKQKIKDVWLVWNTDIINNENMYKFDLDDLEKYDNYPEINIVKEKNDNKINLHKIKQLQILRKKNKNNFKHTLKTLLNENEISIK